MIRVADYIAQFVRDTLKVDRLFMVSGGGMMFLSDGVAQCKGLEVVCSHHEQAAAMGAVGYAKYRNDFGVAMLTTGCGGTNAITGLLNAWQDSTRVLFISGQCKRKQTIRYSGVPVRQFGVQEADIIAIVQPITKYAVMISEPTQIAYELEKAVAIAQGGRPGPVWIDVPMDVQGALIDPETLPHYTHSGQGALIDEAEVEAILSMLEAAERPLILAGNGIDLAHSSLELARLVKALDVPVVTSLIAENSVAGLEEHFIGRIGTKGCRSGNLAVANADFVLALGCRLSVSSTGHEYGLFARSAKLWVVDIDAVEHSKQTVNIDRLILADVRSFFAKALFTLQHGKRAQKKHSLWLKRCQTWREHYPIIPLTCTTHPSGISLYAFMKILNETTKRFAHCAVVSDAGSSLYVTSQTVKLSPGQRYIPSGGQAEMGFTLPAAIGTAVAGAPIVFAVTGDGSLQMNIQELQTLKYLKVPVKLFVWNNNGYLSIRATQRKFFNERFIGTDATSGVSFPDLSQIVPAYGLAYQRVSTYAELEVVMAKIEEHPGPVVCEVMCDPNEEIVPTIASMRLPDGRMKSLPPEDMYPFLSWEELQQTMIVPPLPRDQ